MRSSFRRLRRILWNLAALLIIVAALAAGVVQLALPWLVRNPERVEQWLSERIHRPVTIGHVSASWMRGGPQLALDQVLIGADDSGPSLKLDRAELALNLFAPFQRNGVWNEFRLVGLEISLLRGDDGRWQLRGLELPKPPAGGGDGFGALGALVLKDLRLHIDDPQRALDLDLAVSELRLLNRGDGLRVLGRVSRIGSTGASVDVVVDSSRDGHRGKAYVGGSDLDLADLLQQQAPAGITVQSGRGMIGIWAGWSEAGIDDASVQIDLTQIALRRTDAESTVPSTRVDALAGVARLHRDGDDWTIDVADWKLAVPGRTASTPSRIALTRNGQPARWTAVADRVDIGGIASLLALAPGLSDGLRRWLADAAPQGVFEHPQLRYDSADSYLLSTNFSGLAISAVGRVPAIAALSGRITGDQQAILLALPEQPLRLEFPGVLRTPLNYSRLGGDVVGWRDDDGWHVETDRLVFEGEGHGGELRGGIAFPPDQAKPSLDVAVAVQHADVAAAKLFWTINTMQEKAVSWLDDALLGGSLTARAVFRGNLADWPFRNQEGRFEGVAELDGLKFAFNPDWPVAENIRATARFINLGLDADIESGQTLGNRIVSAKVSIEHLGKINLELDARAQGKGADLLTYLRATPIGRQNAAGLDGLSVGGQADVAIKLHLPLVAKERLKELTTVDGVVDLRGAALASSKWNIQLDNANGLLQFDQHGLVAKDIAVEQAGKPGSLALAIGVPVADPANTLEMSLRLPLTIEQLLARAPAASFLQPHMQGSSEWTVALAVPKANVGKSPRLRLTSALVGTRIDLPAPIGKDAGAARDIAVALPLPIDGQTYRIDYGGVLTHVGLIPRADQVYAARLDLGRELAGALPERGIVVGGRASELDAGGWIAFAVGMAGNGGGAGLRALDVHADTLLLGDSRIPDVDVSMDFSSGTKVTLAGASVQGTIDMPTDLARAGVTVHLPKLHWPQPPESPPDEDDVAATRSPFAPASAPPLHVWIGDLRLGNAEFGETRLETRPTATGMRIDTLDARSPMLHLNASGDWNGSGASSKTELDLELTAPDLGRVLEGFGFKGLIDGGPTEATLSGSWPGSPTAFALSRLSGTLQLKVGQGRFLEVNPGAGGRLFGLLSLGEIRRRLALDFTDFYKSGTTFNEISGRFDLDGATAYTDNLSIDSPAAEVRITGKTGLKARDYDQQMVVTPKAGVALPVVGAIAAGPVGAAAGFVVQNLFNKQIGAVMRARYKVVGSWDKPVIELIAREKIDKDSTAPAR